MNIFWSWQNDSDPQTNRHFIRGALAKATEEAGEALDLRDAERPELDHDTKNTAGAVEITNTILQKISDSAVFAADLTPIGATAEGKALPNPNVLIELGWAMRELGADRIIVILNTANATIDDLPFDIRHRRALTYKLSSGSNKNTKRAVRESLTSDLARAITAILQQVSIVQATATTIVSVPAKVENPSIWEDCKGRLDYIDTSGQSRSVTIPEAPRGYIRIIPSGWSEEIPSLADIRNSGSDEIVWPVAGGTASGNLGPCEYGFCRIWLTGDEEAGNVAMWFDETGEFWVLHGTAIYSWKGNSILDISSLLQGWRKNLRSAMMVFNRFGVYPTVRVEAGLVGIKGVMWSADVVSLPSPARKERALIHCQKQDWNDNEQLTFLLDAYNKIRDVFSLSRSGPDELQKILQEE